MQQLIEGMAAASYVSNQRQLRFIHIPISRDGRMIITRGEGGGLTGVLEQGIVSSSTGVKNNTIGECKKHMSLYIHC